jgi:hypothetical protein
MASVVPLPFDPPEILTAKRVTGLVVVPENELSDINANPLDLSWNASAAPEVQTSGPPALRRRNSLSGNILLVNQADGQKGYFLQRKMAKTTFGCVRVGFLCEQRKEEGDTGMEWDVIKSDGPYPFEMVAIKMESKEKVLAHEVGSDSKDPTVELSALQMIAAYDPKGDCGVIGTSIIQTFTPSSPITVKEHCFSLSWNLGACQSRWLATSFNKLSRYVHLLLLY